MSKKMKDNFKKLKERVLDSLNNTDESIYESLASIKGNTIVTGVCGSSVTATFAAKVLEAKNNVDTTRVVEPNDLTYTKIDAYENVLSCSYSGNNFGVYLAFKNKLNHYLISSKANPGKGITNLTYSSNNPENSFISLAGTLIPCSILLNYYLDGKKEKVASIIQGYKYNFDAQCDTFEIFTSEETSTACKFLETTFVESGIGIPLVHRKYDYCHGRSTISNNYKTIAIFISTNSDIDRFLLEKIPKYYKEVIVINTTKGIIGDYTALIKCMYLAKYIAETKKIDLSDVNHSPLVYSLYHYGSSHTE